MRISLSIWPNSKSKTGVNVLNDIAAPLGGEVTMAFDGPMIPTPRWKLIFEVYDPTTLQSTIAKLVDSFNREGNSKGHTLQLTHAASGFADLLRHQQSKPAELRNRLYVRRQLSDCCARYRHNLAGHSES